MYIWKKIFGKMHGGFSRHSHGFLSIHLLGLRIFFAVKALPNPHILKMLVEEGMGLDCSSLTELVLADRIGVRGRDIMFTSNNTPIREYAKAKEMGAIINLDDITHIEYVSAGVGMPEFICARYNPGVLKKGNAFIGSPEEAKYGFTREQLFEGYLLAQQRGAQSFGLHTMVASNELNADYFIETAHILFELVVELYQKHDISIEFINLGGGMGIPYEPGQQAVNYEYISRGIQDAYEAIILSSKLSPPQLVMENGRIVTGPYGYLITQVRHKKNIYKEYIGVDATMADLMRPGMYGSYHHITVLGKENYPAVKTYDVTGSLCENNDKFAINRKLPEIQEKDVIVIHDTGAHGHAMGFNYNGKLRSAEILLRENGSYLCIRRAETIDDVLQTIIWDETS